MSVEVSLPLLFGLIIYILIDIVSEIIIDFKKKVWVSNVEFKELIQEIIWFTNVILDEKKIKKFPAFTISHYKHKRFVGAYDGNKIIIYIKNTSNVESIVKITLHETCHYIQHQSNRLEYANYEYYSEKYGYNNNPLEKECRKFENDWLEPCLQYLKSKKIIRLE